MNDLERFSTFRPGFSNRNHNLSPICTAKDFATSQLKHSLTQAAFHLAPAQEWGADLDSESDFLTYLYDAIHFTGMAQLKVMETK